MEHIFKEDSGIESDTPLLDKEPENCMAQYYQVYAEEPRAGQVIEKSDPNLDRGNSSLDEVELTASEDEETSFLELVIPPDYQESFGNRVIAFLHKLCFCDAVFMTL